MTENDPKALATLSEGKVENLTEIEPGQIPKLTTFLENYIQKEKDQEQVAIARALLESFRKQAIKVAPLHAGYYPIGETKEPRGRDWRWAEA